jgi:ubiquinone/menaquinone biosynthesis C-methylase UbiE
MDHYNETFATWNKVASLYEEKFMDLPIYNETYDAFCNELSREKVSVLEVGCGPGNITKYLFSKCPDLDLLGIDIAPNMVDLARKNNPKARFEVMDCRNVDQLDATFDAIVSGFNTPYLSLEDCIDFLGKCSSILKKNGLLYLSFVEGDPSLSGFQTSSSGDRCFFYYYDQGEVIKVLNDLSFAIIHSFGIDYKKSDGHTEVHRIFLARKNS